MMKFKKYIILVASFLSLALVLTACGKSYQGKYKDNHGETLNIEGNNKATMTKSDVVVNGKYKQSKDKIDITFKQSDQSVTLTGKLDKDKNLLISQPDLNGSLKFKRVQ